MQWVRNLYDWVLKWSESKYGTVALVVMAFAEAAFFRTWCQKKSNTVWHIMFTGIYRWCYVWLWNWILFMVVKSR